MRLLDLRGQTWWFKKAIPANCREAFRGRGTYLVNLRTSDVRTAKQRRDELDAETREFFRQIRAGDGAGELSPREWGERYRAVLNDPNVERASDGPDVISEYEIARNSAEERGERYKGRDRDEFLHALHGRATVDQHLEAYLSAKGLSQKTSNERRGLVRRFAQWCEAEGLKLPDINRRTAGRYVEAVIQPMHPRTAKKHLTALRGYFDHLRKRGHVDFAEVRDNPWNDQYEKPTGRKGGTGKQEEREFTTEEVRALLYGEPLTGERSQFDDVTRQVTLIGLLSGMREGEIIGLRVGDVVDDAADGYGRIFNVTTSKTNAGVRRVPVHPALCELVDELIKGHDGKRRPEEALLLADYAGMSNPGDTFGKRFRRFREARGVDDRREGQRRSLINFHSTRRWFVTEAERAGQAETTVAVVVGHVTEKRSGQTFGGYSGGPSGDQYRVCVEAVKLPKPIPG